MTREFFGITFAALEYLVLLPIIIGTTFLLLHRFKKKNQTITQLAGTWGRSLIHNFSFKKELIKTCLLVIASFFLLLALLRPQWGTYNERIKQQGRDLLIALDISRSMLADDCKPNRLAGAKKKIMALLHELSSERVGLILFSGSAFVQCPLTTDYKAFELFLEQVDIETISTGTTAIDQAIKQALESYKNMEGKKTKLLAIFTDGEDFSNNLNQLRREAKKDGLHIFALGVGTAQGSPIPEFDMQGNVIGHLKDMKGNPVITHLNEKLLFDVANQAGGTYIRMTEDETDIKTIAQAVGSFEKEQFEDKKINFQQEQYHYFLFISFICVVLEWLL